uniref:Uncharacterized protein n=1 Tax=Arundo donax TaxID=35708 RepID=A0A0A9F729_ARUDO
MMHSLKMPIFVSPTILKGGGRVSPI